MVTVLSASLVRCNTLPAVVMVTVLSASLVLELQKAWHRKIIRHGLGPIIAGMDENQIVIIHCVVGFRHISIAFVRQVPASGTKDAFSVGLGENHTIYSRERN